MRQKRAKAYKKQMATYERTFNFRTPYQILITADFLTAARSFHLDPIAGLKRTVQGEVKSMISQCCIKTLYDTKDDPEIRLAKSLERRRCGHVETAESPADCVAACVGSGRNKNRYIVATQDGALRERLRRVPGVPLIYINRSVIILEPPSPATLNMKDERERSKVGLSPEEAVVLGKRKRGSPTLSARPVTRERDEGDADDDDEDAMSDESDAEVVAVKDTAAATAVEEQQRKKKRKGVPGPNPLSAKKPKSILKTSGKPMSVVPDIVRPSTAVHTAPPPSAEEDGGQGRNRRKRKHKKKVEGGADGGASAQEG